MDDIMDDDEFYLQYSLLIIEENMMRIHMMIGSDEELEENIYHLAYRDIPGQLPSHKPHRQLPNCHVSPPHIPASLQFPFLFLWLKIECWITCLGFLSHLRKIQIILSK